jgi:hypothetical protein
MELKKAITLTTPEEAAEADLEFWRSLTCQERLNHCLRLIYEGTTEEERKLERVVKLTVLD